MTLQEVLADRPKVHAWTPGKMNYSGFADEFFEYIFKHIGPASATLETGAGISTVVFALSGARHLCVNPVAAEAERLKAYCDARGISTAAIDFQTVPSDQFYLTWKSHPLDLADRRRARVSHAVYRLVLYVSKPQGRRCPHH